MTTPNGSAPDGAWVVGSSYGSDLNEDSIRDAVTQAPIDAWQIAQDSWKYACQQQRQWAADLRDGQNGLKNRLDLLEEVSAYGAAVMGYSWRIPHSTWVVLPFETQLGPAKGVTVSAPVAASGLLTLKKGGLWRIDAHATVEGYTYNMITASQVMYSTIVPRLMIELVDHVSGSLISATRYDFESELSTSADSFISPTVNAPQSGAFSKTFVLPEMLPEDDPEASESWVDVRVSVFVDPNPINGSLLSITEPKVLGGTKLSALSATRWSRDSVNLDFSDTVPDGGNLG